MSKFDLSKRNIGHVNLKIETAHPEKFLNLLWKNNILVKNIKKENITTMILQVNVLEYNKIKKIAKATKTKMKVVGKKGIIFFIVKIKNRISMLIGFLCFLIIIYYLSSFVWSIDISTEKNLAPYEVRQQLYKMGIKPGMPRKSINIYSIEDKLKSLDDIMWVRVRIEGSRLNIKVVESKQPPDAGNSESAEKNLVAKKDGQVIRAYTTSGTVAVKPGEIVKKGQVLVKAEAGKEGSTYVVPAKGYVIAKTFYEEVKKVPLTEVKKTRTGNKITNIYIEINHKKLYIKHSNIDYDKYEKEEDNRFPIKLETYYEVKEKTIQNKSESNIKNIEDELYNKIVVNLAKTDKIIDKTVESNVEDNKLKVRMLLTAEENIAVLEGS